MERSEESSMDEVFLQKLREAVFENLQNEQFGVENLASIIGLSRSQLHRRLNKINGKSLTQFIREIRLEEAHRLLEKEVGTVSEIAYWVGFSSPTYFNTCFHEHFGYTPGEVIKKKGKAGNRVISLKTNKKSITSGYGIRIIGGVFFLLVDLLLIWIFFIGKQQPVGETANNYSIAVLPIRSLSDDPEKQYQADGVIDAITAHLTMIKDLRVIARTSMEKYRDKPTDIREIGREVGVNYLIESSFQLDGDKARLIIQLANARDGSQLWAQSYDQEWTDIFEVQSEVAQNIASEIAIVLTPEEKQDIISVPTTDLVAYDYYLRGNDYYERSFTKADFTYAIRMYENAIRLDSGFTLAWVGLAASSRFLYFHYRDRSIEHLQKTKEYLDKAIALEPNRLEVVLEEAKYYYQCKWELDKALKILDRLKSRYPKNAEMLFWMAVVYKRTGDFDKALSLYDQALKLNPLNWRCWNDYGAVLRFTGQYDDAEECLKKSIEINPSSQIIYENLIYTYLLQGKKDKLNELLNVPDIPLDPAYVRLEVTLLHGRYYDAIKILESNPDIFKNLTHEFYSNHLVIALLYSVLSNEEMAWVHFEKEKIYLEEKHKGSINDDHIYRSLGIVYAGLGNKSKAIEYGEKAIELKGISKDAFDGVLAERDMIRILLMVGEYDEAIARLEDLMEYTKYISYYILKNEYIWKPFHKIEKFRQFISESEKNLEELPL